MIKMTYKHSRFAAALLALSSSVLGCSGAGVEETEQPNAAENTTPSAKVAELDLGSGRKIEILETGNGAFGYVQSGPYGSTPLPLPESVARDGDPIAVFRAFAPDKAVPESLSKAVERSISFVADPANEPSTLPPAPIAPGHADEEVGVVQQALGGRDTNQSDSTGQGGCPEWWFNQATVNNQLFCPNTGDAACYKWVNWAFHAKAKANNSYGAICVDSGQAIFQATSGNTVDTFWVDAGTWRFVQYYAWRSCGWFSCSPVRHFQKFEMLNGSAVAHFGAKMN